MFDLSAYGMKPKENPTKSELVHVSKILFDWVKSYPELAKYMESNMSGLVCPDCEEGPTKCSCDNGIKMTKKETRTVGKFTGYSTSVQEAILNLKIRVGNPSAWDSYSEEGSEILRELVEMVECEERKDFP